LASASSTVKKRDERRAVLAAPFVRRFLSDAALEAFRDVSSERFRFPSPIAVLLAPVFSNANLFSPQN
jgi:hypothetical protein